MVGTGVVGTGVVCTGVVVTGVVCTVVVGLVVVGTGVVGTGVVSTGVVGTVIGLSVVDGLVLVCVGFFHSLYLVGAVVNLVPFRYCCGWYCGFVGTSYFRTSVLPCTDTTTTKQSFFFLSVFTGEKCR